MANAKWGDWPCFVSTVVEGHNDKPHPPIVGLRLACVTMSGSRKGFWGESAASPSSGSAAAAFCFVFFRVRGAFVPAAEGGPRRRRLLLFSRSPAAPGLRRFCGVGELVADDGDPDDDAGATTPDAVS